MKNKNSLWMLFITMLICPWMPCAFAEIPAGSFIYPEFSKTISMEFKDAKLNDVLRIFSHQSGLNFIASENLGDKKVSLYFKDVPVEEALEKILHANNLTYEIVDGSGIFIVKPLGAPTKELTTRIYRLKNATVSSSKLNQTISISTSGGYSSDSGSTSSSSPTTSTTDGLVGALKTVLTSSGIIVEDPRTNSIIVTDIPSQFPLIENTLARLDVSVPQILIEVEMLDISKNTAEQMGVKFGNRPLNFEGAERQHLYPWDQNEILDKGFEFTEEYTAGTISAAGLKAALEFLKTQTDTRSLARPRILTLNNQTAQIKISTQEAIGTTTESQSDTGSTSVEAERVETGVSLTVTPQANLVSGEITMAIYPKVTEAKAGATFEDRTFKDPEERGSQSILKVYSGDTIILGGLLKSDDTKTVTKVPFFGDIPILGNAFKHKDSVGRERELVIFITPYIIEDKAVPTSSTSVRQSKKDVYIPLEREQDNSPKRKSEIDRALSTFEGEGL